MTCILIYHNGERTPEFIVGKERKLLFPPTMGGFLLGKKYPVFIGYI